MLRSLIALLVAFAIAVTGVVQPAYADSTAPNYLSTSSLITINTQGEGNSVAIFDSFKAGDLGEVQQPSNAFIDGLVTGAEETIGVAIGGAIVCYSVGWIATAIFPPAGALAPFCSALTAENAVSGGAKAFAKKAL